MRKTFCDRCGAECVNFTAELHLAMTHTTNRGEHLDSEYNEPKGKQLCATCTRSLEEWLGVSLGMLTDEEVASHLAIRAAERKELYIARELTAMEAPRAIPADSSFRSHP